MADAVRWMATQLVEPHPEAAPPRRRGRPPKKRTLIERWRAAYWRGVPKAERVLEEAFNAPPDVLHSLVHEANKELAQQYPRAGALRNRELIRRLPMWMVILGAFDEYRPGLTVVDMQPQLNKATAHVAAMRRHWLNAVLRRWRETPPPPPPADGILGRRVVLDAERQNKKRRLDETNGGSAAAVGKSTDEANDKGQKSNGTTPRRSRREAGQAPDPVAALGQRLAPAHARLFQKPHGDPALPGPPRRSPARRRRDRAAA